MKTIVNTQQFPEEWRGARTILLYKSGEEDDSRNWKPITITSILYRLVFCRIAQTTHAIYELHGKLLCDRGQKGFIPGKAGCVEHSVVSNAIICDAIKKKKSLFVASLDLRDAFGNVPHSLIEKNMNDLGFPLKITGLEMESYMDAFINVQTNNEFTDDIRIGKGVKQGCPLSPTLFNIGIDPHLRRLNAVYQDLGYKYDGNKYMVVQAYADDLLIFADSRENLLSATGDFMRYARITFNPSKCRIVVNNPKASGDFEYFPS
jgi:hypothetical protein